MSEWPTVKQIAAIERKDRKRDEPLVKSDPRDPRRGVSNDGAKSESAAGYLYLLSDEAWPSPLT